MNILYDNYLTLVGILKYYFSIKKACFRPRQVVEAEQYRKLHMLLNICYNEVPYYQELFKKIDFIPNRDFKSLNDLKKIPITTKQIVRKYPEHFHNKRLINKSIIFKTSGSTGNPLISYVSPNQWIIEQAVIWRHWAWAGYRFRDKMAIVRSYAPKDGVLIKQDKIRNFRYYSPFNLTEENIKYYLQDMVTENVKFLRGYPSSLKELALYVLKHNPQIPILKGILVASEILSDGDRGIIEHAFNTKIFNHYGLAEGIVMFGDCEMHRGLHNYDEYGYLELLDTDCENVKEIIGTNLNNYTMPLLRYQTGDFASVEKGDFCSCQRNSRIVKNVIGRSSMVLEFDEVKIPLTNFYTLLEHFETMDGWQIIQHPGRSVELIVQGFLSDEDVTKIKNGFNQRLPMDTDFYISINKPFILKNEGKKNPFVNLK